ncbi:MAG: hypothetical protein CM15mP18_1580 [Methanobacteriota archaeon]|nr:MAG: hypothetical protein CM15mP18_1580 [Euryarchaeota archaeon]
MLQSVKPTVTPCVSVPKPPEWRGNASNVSVHGEGMTGGWYAAHRNGSGSGVWWKALAPALLQVRHRRLLGPWTRQPLHRILWNLGESVARVQRHAPNVQRHHEDDGAVCGSGTSGGPSARRPPGPERLDAARTWASI